MSTSQRILPVLTPVDNGTDSNALDAPRSLSPRQSLLQQTSETGKGLSVLTSVGMPAADSLVGSGSSTSLFGLRDAESQDEEHPKSFICPISGQCMHDPVVLADGHTYERRHIERWLSQKKTSPMTGESLSQETENLMFPNHALRNAIEEYFAIVFSVHRRAIRLAAAATPPLSPTSPRSPIKEGGDADQTDAVAGSLSTASVALKPIAKSRSKGHKRSDFGSNAALLRTVDGLMQCSIMMNSDLTTETVLRRIMDEAKQLVGAEVASVFLVDNKTSELYSHVNSTDKEIRIPMSAGIAGLVATSGAPVLIPEAYKDSRFNKSVDLKTGFQTRNILCVPIKTRSGFVLGVAQLINKGEGGVISGSGNRNRPRTGTEGDGADGTDGPDGTASGDGAEGLVTFTGDDQRFLEVFASQAAAAIYSSGMLEQDQAAAPAPALTSESTIDEAKGAAEAKGTSAGGATADADTVPVKYVGVPGVFHVQRRSKATQTESEVDLKPEAPIHGEPKVAVAPVEPGEPVADTDVSASGGGGGGGGGGDTGSAGAPVNLASASAATCTPAAPSKSRTTVTTTINTGSGPEDPAKVRALLDAAYKSYDEFDALALAQLTEGRPLSTLGTYLFSRLGLNETFKIDAAKLSNFLCAIEQGYDDGNSIPYHNKAHAASVMHMTHATMLIGGAGKMVGAGRWFQPWLQPQEGEGGSTSLNVSQDDEGAFETLATLLAAAIHDFEHVGLSNDFLVKTDNERAIRYNDRSVNENHHVAAAYAVMRRPECNFLDSLPRQEYKALRELVIELVVGTDMAQHKQVVDGLKDALNKHTTKAEKLARAQAVREMEAWREVDKQAQALKRAQETDTTNDDVTSGEKIEGGAEEVEADEVPPTEPPELVLQRVSPGLPYNNTADNMINADQTTKATDTANTGSLERTSSKVVMEHHLCGHYQVANKDDAKLMLKMVLKCADVGHLALPWTSHLAWVERLEAEFFSQGDLEKSLGITPVSFLMDRAKPGVTKVLKYVVSCNNSNVSTKELSEERTRNQ
mmetsp:Transcript_5088/g.11290  ORF Transcript_5088/g.11290 Transcript_5088/m.11290 type:complete len:1032 (-) Transcript_5088:502-3597(-)